MTEQQGMREQEGTPAGQAEDEPGPPAGAGQDADRPGGGRTDRQAAVDDALGSGTASAE